MSKNQFPNNSNDLDRLKKEYTLRESRLFESERYSLTNPSHLFAIQQRTQQAINLLKRNGLSKFDKVNVLELGCGKGDVLLEYLLFGVESKNLYGCDLIPGRLKKAQQRVSHLSLCCADGQALPYESNRFDLILQYTVFSSVLDSNTKQNLAREMLRVLHPKGIILWYDFWLNPTNPQARGIRPKEIRRLFPGCLYSLRKVTLAPPIARRVVPLSWILAHLLEKLGLFNSHYLAVIRTQNP